MQDFHHNLTTNSDLTQLSKILDPLLDSIFPLSLQNLRILNLACGRADETGALKNILKPYTKHLAITGVDIRTREIDDASIIWKSSKDVHTDFIVQDASRLFNIQALREPFDIAFMRHQNFWNGDLTWNRIYDNALHALKPNGTLIITSYFDREHLLAVKAIQSLGASLTTSIRNPRSRTLFDAPNKSVDRHIAIFKLP